MTIDQFRRLVGADPFQSFTVNLADGRAFRVQNPRYSAELGGGRTVIIADPRSEDYEIVDLLLVTSIKVHAARRRRDNGNGRAH